MWLKLFLPAMSSLTVTTANSSSGMLCPQATLTCSAVDFPSLVFLWFFDNEPVAQYTIQITGGMDQYPLDLPLSARFANLQVQIEVSDASQSEASPQDGNFLSVMRANLSGLREAGVNNISCGSPVTRHTFMNVGIGKFAGLATV